MDSRNPVHKPHSVPLQPRSSARLPKCYGSVNKTRLASDKKHGTIWTAKGAKQSSNRSVFEPRLIRLLSNHSVWAETCPGGAFSRRNHGKSCGCDCDGRNE